VRQLPPRCSRAAYIIHRAPRLLGVTAGFRGVAEGPSLLPPDPSPESGMIRRRYACGSARPLSACDVALLLQRRTKTHMRERSMRCQLDLLAEGGRGPLPLRMRRAAASAVVQERRLPIALVASGRPRRAHPGTPPPPRQCPCARAAAEAAQIVECAKLPPRRQRPLLHATAHVC
jgi:hypothetical protein